MLSFIVISQDIISRKNLNFFLMEGKKILVGNSRTLTYGKFSAYLCWKSKHDVIGCTPSWLLPKHLSHMLCVNLL